MRCFLSENPTEVPSKTPAFVREKRIFYQPDRLASPSVLKNVQARQVASLTSFPPPLRRTCCSKTYILLLALTCFS